MPPAQTWPAPPAAGLLGDGRLASERARPANVDDLCAAIPQWIERGLAIYPQGGATSLDYGGVPEQPGVAVETNGLDRVIDYPHADMTITVEAGITLSALQGVLAKEGQFLPLDAPAPDRATLGGIWATNASGPRRFGWGRPRDLIIGVSFVNAEGNVVKGGGRVVKNVAGYDFPKLLTGSLGTLGIITQLTLKVRPRPGSSALAWIPYHDLATAGRVLEKLNLSQTRPVAIELLNRPAAEAVGPGLGLPVGKDARAVLVLGYEDNPESVEWQVGQRLPLELGSTHFIVQRDEASKPLWSALAEFGATESSAFSLLANLTRSGVVPFLAALDPGRWSAQAHAGSGIVRAHALVPVTQEEVAEELVKLREIAARYDGSVIIPRCPADWKPKLGVWGLPREDWSMAKLVKRALDPARTFNPGRFVAGI